tara:strand:- start:11375 stop:13495 length:2121 start_codon:yes stop_codon:yes gene_type:complete
MSRINSKIRQRINSDKLSIKDKRPSNSEGQNGDIRIATVNGVNILFGKISGEWYNFGNGKKIGYRNKAALRQKVSDDHIRQLNVDADLFIKKAKFNVTDIDYLTIDSKVFDIESSNTVSKIYIGDVSLQPTWGTTGSTLKLENAEGHGSDLKILGAGSTGTNKNGGNTIVSSGLKTGSGTSGSITLGAGDSGTSAAAALNVNATSTVLSGTLTINNIDTDTAGDNYLVEVSGVVKKRTPAEVLSDIGVTFGIADTNAVRIDGGDIASGEYARFTSNGLESRTLNEIKTDIGTDNSSSSALVPSAGTSGHFLAHNGAFAQVAYSNLSGTPTIPTNYVTDNADDTMAGTLTIDKDSTQIGGQSDYGISIDYDHTGITAEFQTLSNFGLAVDVNNSTITHVGTHKNYGIANSVRSNTTGTSEVYGIHNYASVGDTVYGIYNKMLAAGTTGYGIYQEVDDGDTDYIQVSSANTADYFKMSTTANGVTVLETIDADAQLAHLTIQPDGKFLMEMNNMDGEDDAWAILNNGHNAMTFKSEEGAENYFKIYDTTGSTPTNYFEVEVQNHGVTLIKTIDSSAANAHLTIQPDGDLKFRPSSGITTLLAGSNVNDFGKLTVGTDGDLTISTTDAAAANAHLKFEPDGSFLIKETANAGGNVANYGQLWVKNDTPNNLYFTDDSGQDVAITNNGSLAGGGGGGGGLNSIVAAMVFG